MFGMIAGALGKALLGSAVGQVTGGMFGSQPGLGRLGSLANLGKNVYQDVKGGLDERDREKQYGIDNPGYQPGGQWY